MMQLGTSDFLRDGVVKQSLKILPIVLNDMGTYIQFHNRCTPFGNTEIFFSRKLEHVLFVDTVIAYSEAFSNLLDK